MQDLICPFGATQAKADFGCHNATMIVRRGGAEFACDAADMHNECSRLLQRLKEVALPEFGVQDDLTEMPHSTLVKIQFGGLLGLQRITTDSDTTTGAVTDIAALVEAAITRFTCVDAIPCESLCEDMLSYKLSRRRR